MVAALKNLPFERLVLGKAEAQYVGQERVNSSRSVSKKYYHLSGWFRGIPDTRRSELHVNLL